MPTVKKLTTPAIVDRLGVIKGQLGPLKKEEKTLVDRLKTLGEGVQEGAVFNAVIVNQPREKTDWAAVCAEAKVPTKIIMKHTKKEDMFVCTVTKRGS